MFCGPILVPKTPFAKTENPQEPLDLIATVGQSCVCLNVSVLVSVCVSVCVVKNDVEVSEKKLILNPLNFSTLSHSIYVSHIKTILTTNGSYTFIL